MALARDHGVALVPQGGNTAWWPAGCRWPRGGREPAAPGRAGAGRRLAGQVTAGAGVTLGALAAHAGAEGLAFGVDLGSRDSATVGGMVATNAGGLHVVRHGAMRAQVVGVEAVLGTGAVVSRLGGLIKDNTGYDLAQLLCGSEGTLGIVTLSLALVGPPPIWRPPGRPRVGALAVALAGDLRGACRRSVPSS